jgi:prophage regulatory protein
MKTHHITPALLRPNEAAAYLGISRRQLYNVQSENPDFPPKIKLTSKCVGFRRADLDAWIASKASN